MGYLNGVQHPSTETAPDDDLEGAVATQTQIRDVVEKIGDVQSSVATLSIVQERTAGDVRVLNTKFDGFVEQMEKRLEAIEIARRVEDWRAWAERTGYAIVGAGALELARLFFAR